MRTRLKDVAEMADVSVKTVSNVVNGYVHVRPQTRERVQKAIDALNYRPNMSARSLRRGRSGVIALAVPELDLGYFAELARHVVTVAGEAGLTVLIDQTAGEPEQERLAMSGIGDQLIDGLILSPLALTAHDLSIREDSTPLVLLGERIHGDVADHVVIDNVGAAWVATEHLIGRGRRRVAAVGAQQQLPTGTTAHLRLRGYREALAAAGIPVEERMVRQVDQFHRADGYRAMRDLLALDEVPDAVFCFNDTLALGALRAAAEAGVRVPEEVAVIGFDDIEDGRFSHPTLSTISPDKQEIARMAVELVQASLEYELNHEHRPPGSTARPPSEVVAHYELVVRESTGGDSTATAAGSACSEHAVT